VEGLRLAVACENLDGPLRARHAEAITNILRKTAVYSEIWNDAKPLTSWIGFKAAPLAAGYRHQESSGSPGCR